MLAGQLLFEEDGNFFPDGNVLAFYISGSLLGPQRAAELALLPPAFSVTGYKNRWLYLTHAHSSADWHKEPLVNAGAFEKKGHNSRISSLAFKD